MQIQIRRILFPTDFSESSQQAKKYACGLASRFGAELHVLNVAIDPTPVPGSTGIYLMPQQDLLPVIVRDANGRLATEIDESVKAKLKLVLCCRPGNPVGEITQYADLHDIDLIVLGTHGRTGFSHVLIGRVAEKVVRLAKCPVLTVHPDTPTP